MAGFWKKTRYGNTGQSTAAQREAPLLLSLKARLWRRLVLRRTRLIAVTGSFGKTTTTRAIHAALGLPFHRLIDLNNPYFSARALLALKPRTRRAAIELGISRIGHMAAQIEMLRPDVGVVTCIGGEHLAAFGDIEGIAGEKSRLVRALPGNGLAALNGDDPRVADMARLARCPVVTFGLGENCDFRAEKIVMEWPKGTRFDLAWRGGRSAAFVPILGKPAVYAALAASAVALSEGEKPATVIERLAGTEGKAGRLHPVRLPNGSWLLRDEFKGAASTCDTALDTLAEIPVSRRIVVFGEMCELDEAAPRDTLRRLAGKAAAFASELVFLGSRKTAQAIRAGARAGGLAERNIHFVHRDFERCVSLLRELALPGDVVLIKARHEVRLDRISLALMGRDVRCSIPACPLKYRRCDACPKLESGWSSDHSPQVEPNPDGHVANDS